MAFNDSVETHRGSGFMDRFAGNGSTEEGDPEMLMWGFFAAVLVLAILAVVTVAVFAHGAYKSWRARRERRPH